MSIDVSTITKTKAYTIKEVQSLLGIRSRQTLLNYTQKGLLKKSYHATGTPFYKGSEIIRFCNNMY